MSEKMVSQAAVDVSTSAASTANAKSAPATAATGAPSTKGRLAGLLRAKAKGKYIFMLLLVFLFRRVFLRL